jgi:hypothetical protein
MISDTEIKIRGLEILSKYLGELETERFIVLLQKESFDYTKWREKNLKEEETIEEISHKAMSYRKNM